MRRPDREGGRYIRRDVLIPPLLTRGLLHDGYRLSKTYMHDLKNILLAWVSAAPTFMAAVDGGNIMTIVSAIILPTIFFLLGKAVDVGVQVYFREKKKDLQG